MADGRGRGAARLLLAAAVVAVAGSSAAWAEGGKPKKKDSPPILRPKEVAWSASVAPAKAKPGETVTYTVTAKIEKPWHVYQHSKKVIVGSTPTTFDLFDADGLEPVDAWTSDRDPIRHAQPGEPALEYFEGQVSWSAKVVVPKSAAAGAKTIRCQVYFAVCDDKMCKPPARITIPDAVVTVAGPVAGGSGAMLDLVPTLVGFVPPPEGTAATAPAKAAPGTIQASIDRGLGSFLLLSAAGGLFAMLMPCVWPMIPITVNFFLKQSAADRSRATGLAVAYCLAIVGIFTALGLGATAAFGAVGVNQLGNNRWINLAFGLAFVAFGLSLLGLFEIRLPSGLLNASARAEGRGGLAGVMFMATTLTITSFTCTAPVVGSLLFLAAKGQYFYPVVGLVTFSAVLSIPFLLLALLPGAMASMPKSGDWMNSVKVVGGLLEIAAAFKFLNVAEVSFRHGDSAAAFFDAQVVLSIWVVTAAVCGLYLLGLFRTDHDHSESGVGPARLVLGVLFLAGGLYLAPALFGNPPRGPLYDQVAGILPPDAVELDGRGALIAEIEAARPAEVAGVTPAASVVGATAPATAGEPRGDVHAKSADPKEAVRQERRFHGVSWGMSLDAALERAKADRKPVIIDFTGVNCANCRTMEAAVMPKPTVIEGLRKFVPVQLYTDFVPIGSLTQDQQEELALANVEHETRLASSVTSPLYVVLDPDGKVLGTKDFDANPASFVRFLEDSLAKYRPDAVSPASAIKGG